MKCLADIRDVLGMDEFGDKYWHVKYSKPDCVYIFKNADDEVRNIAADHMWEAVGHNELYSFLSGALYVDVECASHGI